LNGLIAAGVAEDWSTHMIGQELTALYVIVLVPALEQRAMREIHRGLLLQLNLDSLPRHGGAWTGRSRAGPVAS
jgi:hypothetical protein